MSRAINEYFFGPGSAKNLAALRAILFGWVLVYYAPMFFAPRGNYPAELWQPVWLLDVLGLPLASYETLLVLGAVWKAALLLAALGVLTRVSIAASLILGAYLLGVTHSFHKINHSDAALVLVMAIMLFARCSDRLSVDSWLRANLWKRKPREIAQGEYRWPVRTVWVVFAVIFFLAGYSKLYNGGVGWIASHSMSNIVIEVQNTRPPRLDVREYMHLLMYVFPVVALITVVVELAAPLALFWRWARVLIVPSLLGMQLGIFLLMGDDFRQFMVLYLFFVPWDRVGTWVSERLPGGSIEASRMPAAAA